MKKITNRKILIKRKKTLVSKPEIITSKYEKQKQAEKAKHKKLTIVIFVFIFAFFAFGLVAQYIFGKNSPITKVAEDNILAVVNIVYLVDNYFDVIIRSFSTLFAGFVIIMILLLITRAIGMGSSRRKTIARLLSSFIKYIGAIVTFMLVLSVAGVDTTTLLASVGILGLVIGLGAQSLISDILAGLFIVFENSFQVDDIITVGTFRGTVIDIGLRTTRIKDIGGDVMIINNSELRSLINMSQHSSFAICDVTIEYGEKIEKVEKVLEQSVAEISAKLEAITEGPLNRGVIAFSERGVVLRIVARCDEEDRIQLNRDLAREIKILFDKHKIKIALPKVELKK